MYADHLVDDTHVPLLKNREGFWCQGHWLRIVHAVLAGLLPLYVHIVQDFPMPIIDIEYLP